MLIHGFLFHIVICAEKAVAKDFSVLRLFLIWVLTRNDPLWIKWVEGVVHKHPSGGGLSPSQFVLHDQSVVAIVDVRGLVEEETAVLLRSIR